MANSKGHPLELNPRWRGGRYLTEEGYVRIRVPGHPDATQRGYVLEHRLVMEHKLGRRLLRTEVIHHINHVRDDNRPENLALMGGWDHHQRLHRSGR